MIKNSDIKEIFQAHLPKGKRTPVSQIHNIVVRNFDLTNEDKEPHPAEINRGSSYPKWKRKVQAVLHTMKLNQEAQHFEDTNEYIF